MNYTIAPASKTHVEEICAIWYNCWHEAHARLVPEGLTALRTAQSFHERTVQAIPITWVALADTRVVGFCMIRADELYQMYVAPEARGSGLAVSLIGTAESCILSDGYKKAWLACAIGNDRAARFYEKSGWSNIGTRVEALDTSTGKFEMEVWRFEKALG